MNSKRSFFVPGWEVVQQLGEGMYGNVHLLVRQTNGECVAMKMFWISKSPNKAVYEKEAAFLKILQHKHVISYLGQRLVEEFGLFCIFMEFAENGELYDRIEPDIGMPQSEAQYYFKQLISGVEFLHSKGVAHRDLKPENLLLNRQEILKICDFGMATVFKSPKNGGERLLETVQGTLSYMAPEVTVASIDRPYSAPPADIWSCGVILVGMLAGELPWVTPNFRDEGFEAWRQRNIRSPPWCRIDNLALSLLRKVLMFVPADRADFNFIENHRWFRKLFRGTKRGHRGDTRSTKENVLGTDEDGEPRRPSSAGSAEINEMMNSACSSQPELSSGQPDGSSGTGCFSQPTSTEAMFLSTQTQPDPESQSSQRTSTLKRLVKRMTRFLMDTSIEDGLDLVEEACSSLGCHVKRSSPLIVATLQDRNRMELVVQISFYEMVNRNLVDCRLSKGNGIEFKRFFSKLKAKLGSSVSSFNYDWSMYQLDIRQGMSSLSVSPKGNSGAGAADGGPAQVGDQAGPSWKA